MKPSIRFRGRTVVAAMALVVAGGCASPKPEPITERANVAEVIGELFDGQEPVGTDLSLAEVMARAISYNIDHRVAMMEEAAALAAVDVARMDMLPRLAAQAGYYSRSNENASSSRSVTTGQETLEPSVSSERRHVAADVTMVWNILDFGVSYVAAKQAADEVSIFEERRRKALQNIMQDVRQKYWNAFHAQRSVDLADRLIRQTEESLDQSRSLLEQGLANPEQALRYQQILLATLRDLWKMRHDMAVAEVELAQLINARPGETITLKPDPSELVIPSIEQSVAEMEQYALVNRPELREEDYQVRINNLEVKKAMMRMFPGLEIDVSGNYDDDRFLVHDTWSQAGVRVTWNLFNLFAGPAFKRQAEANVMLDDTRRLAISMAVLTQVNVAAQRFGNAVEEFRIAEGIYEVSNRSREIIEARQRARVIDDLIAVHSQMDVLVNTLRRDQAFVEVQNALGRVHNSLGLDPMPDSVSAHDIDTLSSAISEHQDRLNHTLGTVTNIASL